MVCIHPRIAFRHGKGSGLCIGVGKGYCGIPVGGRMAAPVAEGRIFIIRCGIRGSDRNGLPCGICAASSAAGDSKLIYCIVRYMDNGVKVGSVTEVAFTVSLVAVSSAATRRVPAM